MSKKGTKKIYSQRQRQKRSQQRNRNKTQRLRNLAISRARRQKLEAPVWNVNNITHTVPIRTVITEPNETVMDEVNAFEIVNLPNTAPTEAQILGLPRRGKYLRKNTRRLSNKEKQRLNFKQTRKQRQSAIQQARQMKQEERQFENAEETNGYDYIELPVNYSNTYSNTNNTIAQLRRYRQEQMDLERMEEEYEQEQRQKAQEEYRKAEKNKFYFRFNSEKLLKINVLTQFFNYIRKHSISINKLEFAYLDPDYNQSYCYLMKLEDHYNYSNNEYNYESRYRPSYHTQHYAIYKKNPVWNLFRPPSSYLSLNYHFNENDMNTMGSTYIRQIEKDDLRQFLRSLPFVREKLAKERVAKYTAPVKLKDLQMKAVESAVGQFERKTGRTFPQNTQNILEQMIKPIDYRYYQGRDNLKRINTSLFQ